MKFLKLSFKIIIVLAILLVAIYLLGPSPITPVYDKKFPHVSGNILQLRDSICYSESHIPVKSDNEARILFANDSLPTKTNWAIVYLHGFSASQKEGDPVHIETAKRYGMNLYLARLSDHGIIDKEPLLDLTPDRLWKSAKSALAIGHTIGDKVIIMSTSTGGTLAIMLAAAYPELVDGLINYSPNIKINNDLAYMLNNHWGLSIAKWKTGSDYFITFGAKDSVIAQYWNTKYRLEAVSQLEELLESSMSIKTFNNVVTPSLTVAYYKDEINQDPIVMVSAMEWMHGLLGTPGTHKKFVKLPSVSVHPMASGLRSKDIASVEKVTDKFIEEVLSIDPTDSL